MRASVLPLRLWAVLTLACCACSGWETPSEPEGGPGDEPPPVQEVTCAFFILQHADLSGPDWPAAYQDYRIFVCNPSLQTHHLEVVRRDITDAVLLAYTNAQDVSIGVFPNDPYYQALTDAFDENLCLRDLATGELFSFYQDGSGAKVPAFIVRQASADVLVEFHRTVTMAVDWDGFYIDVCPKEFPPCRQHRLMERAPLFDFDGDGLADSLSALVDAYRVGRAYFTESMRETFGPSCLLLANSSGPLGDPALNGITLEGVGDRFLTVAEARSHLLEQQQVSVAPFQGVLWATTDLSAGPSLELCREMPGLAYGVLRQD